MHMNDEINQKLRKFDEFLTSFTRNPTDENIGLYERWIDCRYDIENILKRNESGQGLLLPCTVGDTIYIVDTDVRQGEPLHIDHETVECIAITSNNDILFKYDHYDGIICHLEHLNTDKLYLGFYRCFSSEEDAKKFIEEQEGRKGDRDSREIER